MALSTLPSLKTYLKLTTSAEDVSLQQYLDAAIGAVIRYCGWQIESADRVEFYSGNNRKELILRCRYVTNLVDIWVDPSGYYGDGPNAFADATKLVRGTDYVLVRDDQKTPSVGGSGVVRRIGAIPAAGFGVLGYSGGFWRMGLGGLSGLGWASVWPAGDGNIKVSYTAGFTNIPPEITTAVNSLAATIRLFSPNGRPMASESYIDYSYTLLTSEDIAELSSPRQWLAPYREIWR